VKRRIREFCARLEWVVEVYRLKRVAAYFSGLVALWLLAALVLWFFERPHTGPGERFHDFWSSLWSGTVFLVSGIEFEPKTAVGKLAAVLVMLSGFGMLGLLGTSILAAVVESVGLAARVRRKPTLSSLEDHVVICGWSSKGDAIVREVHSEQFDPRQRRAVVIVHPRAHEIHVTDRPAYRGVWAVSADPVEREALEAADVSRAHSVIVLADDTDGAGAHAAPEPYRGSQSPARAADAQTILVALALEAVAPGIHTCAEVLDRGSVVHFERTAVRELVCIRDVASRLIAHAAHKHHLTEFFLHLLTVSSDTNEIYVLDVPASLVGATFADVQRAFQRSTLCGVIPIGVQRRAPKTRAGQPVLDRFGRPVEMTVLTVNPRRSFPGAGQDGGMRTRFFSRRRVDEARVSREHELEEGDKIVVIARTRPDLAAIEPPRQGDDA